LRLIASRGADAFYTGELGKAIDAEMKAVKGFLTLADLAADRAEWRKPITLRLPRCRRRDGFAAGECVRLSRPPPHHEPVRQPCVRTQLHRIPAPVRRGDEARILGACGMPATRTSRRRLSHGCYKLRIVRALGNAHALTIDYDAGGRVRGFTGAADPRGSGLAKGY